MRELKFRACPILSDRYRVGSDGSAWGIKGKPIKQYKDVDGYPHVYLVKGQIRCYRAVHKLILGAFVPKPSPKYQVNHKNGKRDDNRLENLEWVTSQENTKHGWARGRKHSKKQLEILSRNFSGSKNPKAKLSATDIKGIRLLRDTFKWQLKQIGRHYGISVAQVSAICNNKFWKND